MLNWYEPSLSAKERKKRGHFSTPPLLVERILDACGYTPDQEIAGIRVFDPACGSGNFVACAARRLLTSGIRKELSHDACVALVQHNIWGFDLDTVACFLAELQLQKVIADIGAQFIAPASGLRSGSDTTMNVISEGGIASSASAEQCKTNVDACRHADVLDAILPPPLPDDFVYLLHCAPPVHFHLADGLALAWEHGETVDLFLANPPYLAAKNSDLSDYRSIQRRGQSDSYLLFLDLALHVVRPNGWIGLVLPDPFLARSNAARERQRLLAETTIHHLWHLSGVFAAHVGAVALIAQKRPPSRIHAVSWVRAKWTPPVGTDLSRPPWEYNPCGGRDKSGPTGGVHPIPQSLFVNQPRAELRYLLHTVQGTLIEQLHAYIHMAPKHQRIRFAPLSALVSIRRGEELGKNSQLLSDQSPDGCEQSCYPVLLGGVDVHPYKPPIGQRWIARQAIAKPLERYLAPKLLVVKSTDCLQATLGLQGHVVLQTLYLLSVRRETGEGSGNPLDLPPTRGGLMDLPPTRGGTTFPVAEEDQLYFLMALLNSRLLREYVYVLHTAYKWVQPQIEQHVLACLPIPTLETDETHEIIAYAKQLREAYSQVDASVERTREILGVYERMEHDICMLYERVISAA